MRETTRCGLQLFHIDIPPQRIHKEPVVNIEKKLSEQAIRREYIRTQLPDSRLSVTTSLFSTIFGTVFKLLILGCSVFVLIQIGVISEKYLPNTILNNTSISIPFVLYLIGPLLLVLSTWIFFPFEDIERAIRIRLLASDPHLDRRDERLIDETIQLEKDHSDLVEKIIASGRDDFLLDEHHALAMKIHKNNMKLQGPPWISKCVFILLLAINWISIGTLFYYGTQWAFFSQWIAIPVLCLWIIAMILFTLGLFDRDTWLGL